jgi:hypothetical protein
MAFCPQPKPAPRVLEKQQKRADEAKAIRDCYRLVDARDKGRCRVCKKRASPTAVGLLERMSHHHMVYRSKTIIHESWNVLSVCSRCDAAIHVEGVLRVTGDADLRDELGKFCGVVLERLTEAGWTIDKLV